MAHGYARARARERNARTHSKTVSRVTHMDVTCRTREGIMTHIQMIHVAHIVRAREERTNSQQNSQVEGQTRPRSS